jgi:hypothetical protein
LSLSLPLPLPRRRRCHGCCDGRVDNAAAATERSE